MSPLRVVGLFVRRIRSERAAVVGLGALVLATALVFALAPRLLTRVADDALRSTVTANPVSLRNLAFDERGRIGPPADAAAAPLAAVDDEGATILARLPGQLRSTISDTVSAADTTRWSMLLPGQSAPGEFPPILTLRFEPRAVDHLHLVEGRLPAGAPRSIEVPATPTDKAGRSPVYEIALAEPSAARIGVHVGDTIYLRPDRSDPLASNRPVRGAVEIVGIYAVNDPNDPFWFDEAALVRPTIRVLDRGGEHEYVDLFGLASPEAYATYLDATAETALPLTYHWHMTVDPARLDAATTRQVQSDLRRVETIFPATAFGSGGPVLSSSLLSILVRQDAEWQSALAILTAIAIGPAAVAAAALALVALLTADRRRSTVRTWRARGGSELQLLVSALFEALVLTVPAVAIAIVAAIVLVPGGDATATIAAALAVGAAATTIVVATIVPAIRGAFAARPGSRRAVGIPGAPRRRLVFELLVVGLAAASIWLLRERSVHGAGGAGAVGIDPLVAAAPALGGIAAGLIAMRLVVLPMRVLARLATPGRGLVVVLALRRATRGGAGAAVLLVLLATAMIGAFSSGALVQLDRSAVDVAWHDVGAPIRVAATGTLGAFDATSVPGVEAAAAAYRTPASVGSKGLRLTLLAVDPAAYAAVTHGLPVDATLPAELDAPAASFAGGPGPLPAVISTALAADPAGVRPGARFTIVVDGRQTPFQAVAARDAYPTLEPSEAFVVVSRPQLEAFRRVPLTTTDVFIRAPDAAVPAIREAAARATSGSEVLSRSAETQALRDSPIVRAVGLAVTAAAIVAAAYAALAVAAALALASAARTSETAILRTFGLSRRDAVGLVVAEHGPIVGLAFVVGVALGFALYLVLRPGLGLTGIIGSGIEVAIAIEPVHLALLLALIVIIAAVGIGLGAAIQRRALLATAVRRGVE